MVISAVPLNEVCATYEREIGERQGTAIAFDKYDASYLGLLKVDALSLITMGMVAGKFANRPELVWKNCTEFLFDDEKSWKHFAMVMC